MVQSLTGGRVLMGVLLAMSFFDDLDGEFRAIRLGEPRLFFQLRRQVAAADSAGGPEPIEADQPRRRGLAAVVALALLPIDAGLQSFCHRHSPCLRGCRWPSPVPQGCPFPAATARPDWIAEPGGQ